MEVIKTHLKQRGIALLLALMMVTFMALLVVFASGISTGQLRLAGSSSDSGRAFGAADAGIEYALSRINLGLAVGQDAATCKCGTTWCPAVASAFTSKAEYCVTADDVLKPKKITAVGRTTDTKIRRSIEVLVPVFAAVNGFDTFCLTGVASQNLNTYCTGKGYAGATGLAGDAGGFGCNSDAAAAIVFRTKDDLIPPGNFIVTLSAAKSYVVQCYK